MSWSAAYPCATRPVTRAHVEEFLTYEAALLDEWLLDEWLGLFSPDAYYVVPSTDLRDGDPGRHLVLINDDMVRLRSRVKRLNDRKAYREFPWSRTRRLITNVRIIDDSGDSLLVTANFIVYRIRGSADAYVGRYVHKLEFQEEGRLRFVERRAEIDLEALRPHGTVSIIL